MLNEPTASPVAQNGSEITTAAPRDMRVSRLSVNGTSNADEQKFYIENMGVAKLKRKKLGQGQRRGHCRGGGTIRHRGNKLRHRHWAGYFIMVRDFSTNEQLDDSREGESEEVLDRDCQEVPNACKNEPDWRRSQDAPHTVSRLLRCLDGFLVRPELLRCGGG